MILSSEFFDSSTSHIEMENYTPAFEKDNFEDRSVLSALENILTAKRGFVFSMPKPGQPALILVSGGVDSICLWYLLLKKYRLNIYPVHFLNRLYRRSGQINAVKYYSHFFQQRFPSLFHPVKYINIKILFAYNKANLKQFSQNLYFLTSNMVYDQDKKQHKISVISNPLRLGYYLVNTEEYCLQLEARGIKINTIFCGITPDDGRVNRESTLTVLRSFNVNIASLLGDWSWQISAPIEKKSSFYYSKFDLARLANSAALPLDKTWSCDRSLPLPCGACASCVGRRKIFNKLKIKDRYSLNPSRLINFKNRLDIKNRFFAFLEQLFKSKRRGQEKTYKTRSIMRGLFSIGKDISWHMEDLKLFLIKKDEGSLVHLNETGSFIFNQIIRNKKISFKKIFSLMKDRYRVSKKKLIVDLVSFLNKFLKKGYLIIHPPEQ